jgi:VIT1/CCC1 family predicted Fe2+/Mn2+ transporter
VRSTVFSTISWHSASGKSSGATGFSIAAERIGSSFSFVVPIALAMRSFEETKPPTTGMIDSFRFSKYTGFSLSASITLAISYSVDMGLVMRVNSPLFSSWSMKVLKPKSFRLVSSVTYLFVIKESPKPSLQPFPLRVGLGMFLSEKTFCVVGKLSCLNDYSAGEFVNSERHARPTLLSNFILGSQDGLVNVLGILLGLAAASADVRVFFVAAFAALGAESISMGAVAYTSARRQVYLRERGREMQEMKDVPEVERGEVELIFSKWGYVGKELENVTDIIVKNPKAMLEFMMGYELNLASVDKSEALRSFFIVLASTILGSAIPLFPFFFTGSNIVLGTEISVVFSGVILFMIGVYEAKTTIGSLWRSGLQMAAIGLTAGLAGFLIGHFVGGVPI